MTCEPNNLTSPLRETMPTPTPLTTPVRHHNRGNGGQTLIEGSQSFVEFPSLYVKAYNNVSNFRMGVILGDSVGPIRVVKSSFIKMLTYNESEDWH